MNDGSRHLVRKPVVAAVIPCYRVGRRVLGVIAGIGPEVDLIYVVDDACPEQSHQLVANECRDPRVRFVRNAENQGVGGAVMAGYRAALDDGADVMVKIDGDGQMDPALVPAFIGPVLAGEADYTKGNRFYDLTHIGEMPGIRVFGNAITSFMAKLSTGYWDVFDPSNGYTAIHAEVVRVLPMDKISRRYFFETDLLFRLNTIRAVVVDVPMDARYGDEISNLHISRILGEFVVKHARNFAKRIFYNYFLRNLSLASLELVLGILLAVFGASFGGYHWWRSVTAGVPTLAGTAMLSAVPLILGVQLVLAFLGYDIASVPRRPIWPSRAVMRHSTGATLRRR